LAFYWFCRSRLKQDAVTIIVGALAILLGAAQMMVAIKEWAGAVIIMEVRGATVLGNVRLIIGRRVIDAMEILKNTYTLICIVLALLVIEDTATTIITGTLIQIAVLAIIPVLTPVRALCSSNSIVTVAVPVALATITTAG